jgi:hypothetical protein
MGFRNIVRLNWGYGNSGTIPTPDRYAQFAQECAEYVRQSPGVDWVIIGNEPNHSQEWANGQMIEPEQYAKCFNLCYTAIRNTRIPVRVMTAAVAPWNQQAGDWLWYYRTMLSSIAKCDGFSLHAYTHGTNPDLIYSDQKVEGWYWHFRTYLDQLRVIDGFDWPLSLPAFITESDQDETWRDTNSGWIQNAMVEVNAHNNKAGVRKIHSCVMYRWLNVPGDKWGMEHKNGVIEDFKAAAALGYRVDAALPTPPPDPGPTPPTPTPPPAGAPGARVDWDERLTIRGCTLQPALTPSDIAPIVKIGRWFNEQEAGGRVNIFVRLLDENGNLAIGVPVTFFGNDGDIETKPTERKSDPWLESKGLGRDYSLDFNMQSVAPAYGIRINGGYLGDVIDGCGLGSIEAPHHTIHTAYFFEWRLTKTTIQPPIPPIPPLPPHAEIEAGIVIAPAGLNLRMGPGTEFPVLGTLRVGSTVLCDEELEGWLHVVDGWVSADYVGTEVPALPPVPPLPAPPVIPGGLVHPLPGSVITFNFYQESTAYEQFGFRAHNGTDFGGLPLGTPILAMADGVVTRVEYDVLGYGHWIMLAHDQKGAYTMYCHATEVLVPVGKVVSAGKRIALLGSSGNSTGVHLHLEIRGMNLDGSYREGTPMPKGRVDPRTWAFMHGLTL